MKILGIDFGLKHIGLALAEDGFVSPYGELSRINDLLLIKQIQDICEEHKINQIIIGLPQGPLESIIKNFSELIKSSLSIPVILHDETLSSQEAVNKMIEVNKPKLKRKQQEHIIAACLILEDYLDTKQ